MTLIAVTGGIGTGKSTVVREFQCLGAFVADADDIAHTAYLPGNNAYNAMIERWGKGILDAAGAIHRKSVAQIVFSNKDELKWLNSLVHPFVRDRIQDLSKGRTLFCAIPLLFESGWEKDCHAVISAWCTPEDQMQRLLKRGWDMEEIKRRLSSQISLDEKLHRADFGILTSCTWEALRTQCKIILDITKICE